MAHTPLALETLLTALRARVVAPPELGVTSLGGEAPSVPTGRLHKAVAISSSRTDVVRVGRFGSSPAEGAIVKDSIAVTLFYRGHPDKIETEAAALALARKVRARLTGDYSPALTIGGMLWTNTTRRKAPGTGQGWIEIVLSFTVQRIAELGD